MPDIPNIPNIPAGAGSLQQRAAQLKAEMEAKQRQAEQEDAAKKDDDQDQGTGPVGQGDYEVKEGDCISSIAMDTGHFWETIWNDSANAELQEVRKDPNVLFPKDRVTIPEIKPKEETGETEMRHRFVRLGEPSELNLTLLHEDKPIANAPYKFAIDGRAAKEGVTTADGSIHEKIPGNARVGMLTVETESQIFKYRVPLGHMPPIETRQGVQKRLINLGFLTRAEDDWGPRTESALKRFQSQSPGLEVTGKADEATRAKLKEAHKS